MGPKHGDFAPNFEAETHDGRVLKLSDFRGKKSIVLFFYPGDFTPVCTTEACGFREIKKELADFAFEVVGVSTDSLATHRRFAAAYHIDFPLISDENQLIAKEFGATNLLCAVLGRARRVTFVIDSEGRVHKTIRAELSARVHIDGVREALLRLGRPIANEHLS